MVADTAPRHLRGTAYGCFNLACAPVMLSPCGAGILGDQFGAAATFYAGALFCVTALAVALHRSAPHNPSVTGSRPSAMGE